MCHVPVGMAQSHSLHGWSRASYTLVPPSALDQLWDSEDRSGVAWPHSGEPQHFQALPILAPVAAGLKLHPHAGPAALYPGSALHILPPVLLHSLLPSGLWSQAFGTGKCILLWVTARCFQWPGGRAVLSMPGEGFAATFCEWVKCLL